MTLEATGERLIPEAYAGSLVLAEHLARYRLAARLASGRTVLDVACGEGYGSAMLAAAGATSVVGVDIDAATVAHASERHGIDAREGDITALPFADGAFELIVCFETVEHVADSGSALDELRRTLAPGGIVIISTPNRDEYLEDNPYHHEEMTLEEFAAALSKRFATVDMRYQQTFLTSAVLREASLRSDDGGAMLDAELSKVVAVAPERALYGVAACGDGPLPDLGPDVAIASDMHEAHHLAEERRNWIARATEAERMWGVWEALAREKQDANVALQDFNAELERRIQVIADSLSWRITRPLRDAMKIARRVARRRT